MSADQARLTIKRRHTAGDDIVRFLESVEFGGKGLRYRRKHLEQTLSKLGPSEFFTLGDQAAIVGSYALTGTSALIHGEPVAAVYRGLLAIAPSHRRRGLGRQLVESALAHLDETAAGGPLLSFGLIETANTASLRLLDSLGASDVGSIESRLVYRQWPRPSTRLRRLDASWSTEYAAGLAASTPASGLSVRTAAGFPVFALVDNDRLQAAARIGTTTIDLGPGGPLARVLHRFAYSRFRAIGKRYNRRAFRYVTIHDPLVVDEPAAWQEFVDAILARLDAHMALFTLDPRGEASRKLHETGLFGRFSRATRQEFRIMASGWNLETDWEARLRAAPVSGGPVY